MDIVLVAGLWLDGSAWDAVVPELEAHGHRAIPVTLPGQGEGSRKATLDDQVAAVVAAVDGAHSPPLVVGHSAACTLAWLAVDRRPDRVRAVALIGGFPSSEGEAYADFFPTLDGLMPFPGWEPFEGPDAADLDEAARTAMAQHAVPVPEGVAKARVHYTDDRRYDLPVLLVCPEFSPGQAKEWIAGGDVPELAKAARVDYVDIDSGHWPMFTKPADLARILADAGS
jgi:pimeloyl-ACP methyl ester carboxylesterase